MDILKFEVYEQKTTKIKMKVLKYAGTLFGLKHYVVENVETGFKWVENETMFNKKTI